MKFNLKFGTKKDKTEKKQKKEVAPIVFLTEEQEAKAEAKLDKDIKAIKDSQDKIKFRTAALDALFVRRFKKFQSVQEYLDLLKIMKLHEVYEEQNVDLDNGSTDSIDAFCASVLKKTEYKKNYREVQLIEVEFEEELDEVLEEEHKESSLNLDEEVRIQFFTKEDEDDVQENDRSGKSSKEDVERNVSKDAKSAGSKSSGSKRGSRSRDKGTSGEVSSVSEDKKRAEAKKETDAVAHRIARYVAKGTDVSVTKTLYSDGTNIGTYDVKIVDDSGERLYAVDNGSIIPGKLSVITSRLNGGMVIAVPIIKREEELVRKIFASVYMVSDEEFDYLSKEYYLPDMTLYNSIDFTDITISNLTASSKEEFAKNLKYVVESIKKTTKRDLRFRISKFIDVDNFELSSDSKCVSPIPALLTSNDIGFITATFAPNQNIRIGKSKDRILREEHEAKANKAVS